MNKLFSFALATAALLLVGCSGDASPEQQELWQAVVSDVVMVLFALATPVLLVLVAKLLQVARDKWGIEVSVSQEQLVMGVVQQGLAYAEEQSRKALKEGKTPKTGDEKKIEAVRFVTQKLESLGVLGWGGEKLGELVESALNMSRPPESDEAS